VILSAKDLVLPVQETAGPWLAQDDNFEFESFEGRFAAVEPSIK